MRDWLEVSVTGELLGKGIMVVSLNYTGTTVYWREMLKILLKHPLTLNVVLFYGQNVF